jgi:hypothetical protein
VPGLPAALPGQPWTCPPTSSLTETLSSSLSLQNFAKEFVISDRKELEEDFIRSELKKAGGANYDAQSE